MPKKGSAQLLALFPSEPLPKGRVENLDYLIGELILSKFCPEDRYVKPSIPEYKPGTENSC